MESHASVIVKEGSNEGKLRTKSPHVFCTHNDGEIQMNQKWKFRTDTASKGTNTYPGTSEPFDKKDEG